MKKIILSFLPLFTLLLFSCENEPIGKANINTDYIEVNSELYDLLVDISGRVPDDEITCIDFNYSFTLFIFDAQQQFLEAIAMHNDAQFSALLANLQPGQSISLNFPITGTLMNGELVEINNTVELKESIDQCIKEQVLGNCNAALSIPRCVWKVKDPNDPDNPYNDSVFVLNQDGSANYHFENEVYFGTWVTYFIETELHLNIFIQDDTEVGTVWNFDWKLDYFSNSLMILNAGSQTYEISTNCDLPCFSTVVYQECELENSPGYAEFNLQQYSYCLGVSANSNEGEAIRFTFHETEADAMDGINAVSPTSYINTTNPQEIFPRASDLETGALVSIFAFTVEAVVCD
jgi:hypothetical protein